MNQAALGAMLGKSSDWVSVRARVSRLPQPLKDRLQQRPRAITQILELSTLFTVQPDDATRLADRVIDENLSLDAVRAAVRGYSRPDRPGASEALSAQLQREAGSAQDRGNSGMRPLAPAITDTTARPFFDTTADEAPTPTRTGLIAQDTASPRMVDSELQSAPGAEVAGDDLVILDAVAATLAQPAGRAAELPRNRRAAQALELIDRLVIVEPQPPVQQDDAIVELQRIAEMGRAITRLAEQQIELQRQQQHLGQRIDRAGHTVRAVQGELATIQGDVSSIQVRLEALEETVRPGPPISRAQAAEVSQRVKALAELLTTREQGKNFYQGIFGELYRRFRITSYTETPQAAYADVLAFLNDWRRAAEG